MSKKPENRDEMISRLTERFRKLLEEKTPEEPGTLAEIEEISQQIGEQVKHEIEESFCGSHGSGYVGSRISCRLWHALVKSRRRSDAQPARIIAEQP